MAFSYSNPYAPPTASRPAFGGRIAGPSSGYQVLLSGIPLDVRDTDIHDLMVRIGISNYEVTALYDISSKFLGKAIMNVRTADEAELIRQEYSGQTFDADVRLTVHHILSPTQPLPAPSVTPMQLPTPASAQAAAAAKAKASTGATPTGPKRSNARAGPSTNGSAKPAKKEDGKPDGLKLLARLQPHGKDKHTQAALLAKQKANLKAKTPGAALLSRMKQNAPVSAKTKVTQKAPANAANKVARAKANANQGNKAQVNRPAPVPAPPARGKGKPLEKPKKKTQAELDDEMAAFQRSRRFAAE